MLDINESCIHHDTPTDTADKKAVPDSPSKLLQNAGDYPFFDSHVNSKKGGIRSLNIEDL